MRQFLFIISLFSFSSLAAQRRFATEEKLSASLTAAFISLPQFNMGIQPGIIYRFNDRFSLSTETTIRLGRKTDPDSNTINKQYFRVQPELRYFSKKNRKGRENYTGLRLSWASRKFEDKNGFYMFNHQTDSGYSYNRAKINSPVMTVSLQAGTIFRLGHSMGLDFFMGMGARFITTHYTDVVNPVRSKQERAPDGPHFDASYSAEGSVTWFHFNTGFRFIYHFGQ